MITANGCSVSRNLCRDALAWLITVEYQRLVMVDNETVSIWLAVGIMMQLRNIIGMKLATDYLKLLYM